eukprot:TRINITY_DN264_c0_g1_i2.p1 TRINITY_DN264_c0_g1~~TRINITY_DN264_c0_g1_i2.p1  ORF type:complete len:206 (-),score=18.44 TRINITY_DN264_c0_g1_i2:132-749(-)
MKFLPNDMKLMKASKKLIIQEKVDGANVSVHFEEEWQPIPQKRSGLILTNEHPQYEVFRNWCFQNIEMLWEILGTSYVLFGEFLWAKHAVYYDKLPDYFVAFDMLEKSTNKFLSSERMKKLLHKKEITIVPTLFEGIVKSSDLDLQTYVQSSKFSSKEIAEGVYIRFEDDNYVLERAKFRRKDFKSGRANFSTSIENNLLSNNNT